MERLKQRIDVACRAVSTLEVLLQVPKPNEVERDASLQRFEYSFEATWKAALHYLREMEGIEIGSPKGVIRACMQVGLLTPTETSEALEMVDDRNLTVHTYNEELARAIFMKLPRYASLLRRWVKAIRDGMDAIEE
ncbi:nucleotidyltransferase substrate-binding protein, putative [Heliomicrobium modesticaldum Ice1]|uniref:Nucleotidyltransferase substrate-binding protein, putative n=1 Tax=Heliobacterium modesticaldum (strain ATCC 51547 / Ice1) TaxID=498761 RepID=B0TB89_HELMI|nr:HI0074 family nucleotidyltransferase substrate-binding subunit [Heliomicrobium modesticaldum]ABZ83816.1 nucleotidyltransferase substrate-binding protein, putative [Heliomicrobium modesticaldum Ice1]